MLRVRTYANPVRDFAAWAQAMNQAFEQGAAPYDYAASGGATSGGAASGGAATNRAANGEAANSEAANGDTSRQVRLPLDVWETEESFTLVAYLPGVNPDDVAITFDGEELRIQGRFPQVAEERSYIKRELFHGEFERRLTVNVPVNVEAIEAVYDNGLLTLTVPKVEEVRPKQIKVLTKR